MDGEPQTQSEVGCWGGNGVMDKEGVGRGDVGRTEVQSRAQVEGRQGAAQDMQVVQCVACRVCSVHHKTTEGPA